MSSQSKLFEPFQLGSQLIKNRFVRSATYEGMATNDGECTDNVIRLYRNLARGDCGLIITGHMYIHITGRGSFKQLGIHDDKLLPRLKELTTAVHNENGKIIFQLSHAGLQTSSKFTGSKTISASSKVRDPAFFHKPREMTENDIWEMIKAFGEGAYRAEKANADGIQLHAAHGYLINQFLSPFFNYRKDKWGGSDENRFRFLKEIIAEVRKQTSSNFLLLVKINGRDFTPKEGITPELATKYASWLAPLVDGIEISCGSTFFSPFESARGEVPVKDFLAGLPLWQKPLAWLMLRRMADGKYDLVEGYNVETTKMVRQATKGTPLMVVGGLRSLQFMKSVIENDYADFVSLSRPFVREPALVKRFKAGKSDHVACISCNRCFVGISQELPLACYVKGIPKVK